ncbi:ABC transporter ATP-binding protein [Crossiella cryophila]|uniref:ATP-binding cassette subfamily B protein n=1 Tax=Crossiella cryophila TaxID=43355 RepID=A0A7W7CEG4_9PSEU|nr:ABC transporter ATP-binding protein [Crossiella cryophila]MBB4679664.1 ATP-binding cassette subfamily B protein [Crossiella cryophila]
MTRSTSSRLIVGAALRSPGWFALFVLASVTVNVIAVVVPSALAEVINAVFLGSGEGATVLRFGVLVAVAVLAQVLIVLSATGCCVAGTLWIRRRLVDHVLALPVRAASRFPTGELTTRLNADAASAGQLLVCLTGSVLAATTALAALVVLFGMSPWFGAVFALGVTPMILLAKRFLSCSTGLHLRYQQGLAALATLLHDALRGVRTIRAAGTADREVHRVLGPLPELAAAGDALWQVQRNMVWRAMLLVPLTELVVLAMAGFEVTNGRLTAAELLAVSGYLMLALGLFGQIDGLLGLAADRAGVQRVAEVLGTAPQRVTAVPRPLPDGTGALSFRAVTVVDGGHLLLDRVSLEVPGGASLALVGRSGAGKSTLAALVGRLVEPDQGTVLLDGVPLGELDPAELRAQVGYAFERPVLFGATVAEAIAPGTGSRRSLLVAAATAADADTFIQRLPGGYDTALADIQLSAGEMQRLGLARAIAGHPRVLVLDDATSSLDTVTEAHIARALATGFAGRTRLLVAHRAATAARADLVAWLDDGRIRAVGPHVELWPDPRYRAVFGPESLEQW